MVPASLNDRYVIRFCVCAQHARDEDIVHAWHVIARMAADMIELEKKEQAAREIKKLSERSSSAENAALAAAVLAAEKAAEEGQDETTIKETAIAAAAAAAAANLAELDAAESDEEQQAEQEAVDEVFWLDRRNKMSVKKKRSYFVRMVSDPKCYNPKIARTLSCKFLFKTRSIPLQFFSVRFPYFAAVFSFARFFF